MSTPPINQRLALQGAQDDADAPIAYVTSLDRSIISRRGS